MAEIQEDKYVAQIPRFELPKDFGKAPESPKPDIAQAETPKASEPTEQAPVTEGAEPKQAEPLTTGKDPESVERSPRSFKRSIDRATKRAAEAEAKAEALNRELTEWKSKQAPQVDPAEPKMEQFTDIEEYAKAKSEYRVKQELKTREEKAQQEQVQSATTKLKATWTEKVSEAEDKYDDFNEVVGDLQPTSPWAVAVMEADNAADLAYYLGKHMKETQRIIALPPVSQIREIAKLEAKLLSQTAAPQKPSKAPPPIAPITGTATPTVELKPQMPFEEYLKIGNKMFRGR